MNAFIEKYELTDEQLEEVNGGNVGPGTVLLLQIVITTDWSIGSQM